MEVEETNLSDITQTQKNEHGMYSLIMDTSCKAKDIYDPKEAKKLGES